MAAYLIVNLVFMAAMLALFMVKPRWPSRNWLVALAIILVMTAIFDSLIVGLDIVAYDSSKILGIYIGKAPLEDFMYAILAMILVPAVWRQLEHDKSN